MKTLNHVIEYTSRTDTFDLYFIGDIHLGAEACDEKLLAKTIAEIRDNPRAKVILMGDIIDGIGITGSDKRSDSRTLATWARAALAEDADIFLAERDMAVKVLTPIAPKIVAWLSGNHETACEKHRGFNIYASMVDRVCEAAGRNPADIMLGYEGFVRLSFRFTAPNSRGTCWQMIIYAHHGFGGGKLPGSHANNMFHLMGSYPADLHAIGHTHNMITVPRQITEAGNGKNTQSTTHTRWGIVTGSFLRAHLEPAKNGKPRNSYAQEKGLAPLPVNFPTVSVHPNSQTYDITFRNQR